MASPSSMARNLPLEENLAAIDILLRSAERSEMMDALPDAMGERYDAAGVRTVGL